MFAFRLYVVADHEPTEGTSTSSRSPWLPRVPVASRRPAEWLRAARPPAGRRQRTRCLASRRVGGRPRCSPRPRPGPASDRDRPGARVLRTGSGHSLADPDHPRGPPGFGSPLAAGSRSAGRRSSSASRCSALPGLVRELEQRGREVVFRPLGGRLSALARELDRIAVAGTPGWRGSRSWPRARQRRSRAGLSQRVRRSGSRPATTRRTRRNWCFSCGWLEYSGCPS